MKASVVFVCVCLVGLVFALDDSLEQYEFDSKNWSIEEQKSAYYDFGPENDESQSLNKSPELEDKDPNIITKSEEQQIDKEVKSFIQDTLEKDANSLKDYLIEDNRSEQKVSPNNNQVEELFSNEVSVSSDEDYDLSPVEDISNEENNKQDLSANVDNSANQEHESNAENNKFDPDENLEEIGAETSFSTANKTYMDKIASDAQKILEDVDSTEMDQVHYSDFDSKKKPNGMLESDEHQEYNNLQLSTTTMDIGTQNIAKQESTEMKEAASSVLDDKQIPDKDNNLNEDLKSLFSTWDNLTDDSNKDLPAIFKGQVEDEKNDTLSDKIEMNESGETNESFDEVDFDTLFAEFKETTKNNNEEQKGEEATAEIANNAKYKMVESLTDEEYDNLMQQFSLVNAEDLETSKIQKTLPIKINLDGTHATTVTSPNYPNPYPTDQIVDWIIEGDGTGMELNITDFMVNGALGDYLLFKPGGEDASGNQGIILSYQIDHERKFRFLNVNRMFVRFEAKKGMAFRTGFSFNIKMIFPAKKDSIDDVTLPPEALLPAPRHTFTVHLGGIAHKDFYTIEDDFKKLVADMGTLYINANGIETENDTLSTTQITSSNLCNINWPGFETCVAVSFAIPVVDSEEGRLNEEDLRAMWYSYKYQDPFAARLESMGVEEFQIPNESRILSLWMAVAVAATLAVAAVAFALWRFSCFEEYTRMQMFSDTESISKEKRPLDLYPTPHQTLPPLYGDLEYPWEGGINGKDTMVNISGYTNASFARDDQVDFESDGERTTRDGNGKSKIVHDLV